ncbi:hypothetical protein PV371_13315 [Streptomyces sp. TX20-6-3]|uniref:hypothetical protein n=1 Tax=Streptomyces sp. TX20-6-3 TaxID=3028705 RepID=UPI0029B83D96|nr:hypothetical protein [Streptomyces sp. TX20-6-3]MDX2560624.1 hypothetical protein [Streptomyces sp. TX20-6-3]
MDVEEVAEELYGLRPAEFVAARDTYVARARAAKDARAAKAIAALRRPSLAAWAANRLARQRQREAQQFLTLGETLREAHRTLDAEQLRAASGQRQQLVTALARTAGALAGEAGLSVSDTVLHEIEQTLHGVLADQDVAEQWSRGRLVKTPEAVVGFPAVAPGAVPARKAPAVEAAEAPETAEGPETAEAPETTEPTESEEAAEAAEQPVPMKKPARGEAARRLRERERARLRELEGARAAAEEADDEVGRRERELAEARAARQAAAEAAEEAAELVSRLERELNDGRKARQEARTASTAAGKAVTTAEHALRDARRAAAQAADALQDLEGRGQE